ncbi:MAG: RimK family protein [Gemmatimonadota bacterium]
MSESTDEPPPSDETGRPKAARSTPPARSIIVVDAPRGWPLDVTGADVVTSRAYLTDPRYAAGPGTKVFNLCRSYRYQTAGYYVSLLAAARGHRPLPSVATLQDLRLAPIIRLVGQELDDLIQRSLSRIRSDQFELSIYFGRNLAERYDRLSLALFNQFPAPLLRVSFRRADEDWLIDAVRLIGAGEIPASHRDFVVEQARRYFARAPRRPRNDTDRARYDLAILHDPDEDMPPSDAKALARFVEAGREVGIRCELVEKEAYGRVAEYDALFIRETTAVNHHTYRFARRAVAERMVVVDDPESILRCSNKVFLHETLVRHRLPTPATVVFSEDTAEAVEREIGFPCVIKQPDSSFSRGVTRVNSADEFGSRVEELFEDTELLVAQEFVPTDYDWRIGVLGGEPLFACRYFMARGHWQIVHRAGRRVRTGPVETLPLDDVPQGVVPLAVRAAGLIGDGLYGVDLKLIDGRPTVIEINDNPNIDSDVEDCVTGDELYLRVMRHFFARLEDRRR